MDAFVGGIGRSFERLSDRIGVTTVPVAKRMPIGSSVFTAEEGGVYTFLAWGGGGRGFAIAANNFMSGGGSGGFVKKTVSLLKGQTVSFAVGRGSGRSTFTAEATTVTFPDGSTMTAGGGGNGEVHGSAPTPGSGGTATGGDVNIPGSLGGASGSPTKPAGSGPGGGAGGSPDGNAAGGGGAPGDGQFLGGRGGDGFRTTTDVIAVGGYGDLPGGGGGCAIATTSGTGIRTAPGFGADGLGLVVFQKEASL